MVRAVKRLGLLALGFMLLSAARAEDVTRRIVVFSPSVSRADRLAIAAKTGATIVRELPAINAVVIEAPSTQVSAANSALTAMAEVARIDEDPKINWLKAVDAPGVDFAVPNVKTLLGPVAAQKAVSAASLKDAQQIGWGVTRVHAPEAWSTSRGGKRAGRPGR